MIWKCEDCKQVGFFFGSDESIESFRKKHSEECAMVGGDWTSDKPLSSFFGKETIGDYSDFVNLSHVPAHDRKKAWVPIWLWKLVSEKYFEDQGKAI